MAGDGIQPLQLSDETRAYVLQLNQKAQADNEQQHQELATALAGHSSPQQLAQLEVLRQQDNARMQTRAETIGQIMQASEILDSYGMNENTGDQILAILDRQYYTSPIQDEKIAGIKKSVKKAMAIGSSIGAVAGAVGGLFGSKAIVKDRIKGRKTSLAIEVAGTAVAAGIGTVAGWYASYFSVRGKAEKNAINATLEDLRGLGQAEDTRNQDLNSLLGQYFQKIDSVVQQQAQTRTLPSPNMLSPSAAMTGGTGETNEGPVLRTLGPQTRKAAMTALDFTDSMASEPKFREASGIAMRIMALAKDDDTGVTFLLKAKEDASLTTVSSDKSPLDNLVQALNDTLTAMSSPRVYGWVQQPDRSQIPYLVSGCEGVNDGYPDGPPGTTLSLGPTPDIRANGSGYALAV